MVPLLSGELEIGLTLTLRLFLSFVFEPMICNLAPCYLECHLLLFVNIPYRQYEKGIGQIVHMILVNIDVVRSAVLFFVL